MKQMERSQKIGYASAIVGGNGRTGVWYLLELSATKNKQRQANQKQISVSKKQQKNHYSKNINIKQNNYFSLYFVAAKLYKRKKHTVFNY